jgi:HD-like signal output (HDOD) protein
MIERANEKIAKVLRTSVEVPSLPEVVDRVLNLSERGVGARLLSDVIGKDQGLTAKVLRVVNSAFYSLSQPISSLSHAISLLGERTVKIMVLSISIVNLFRDDCPGFETRRFWRHSYSVAFAMKKLGGEQFPGFEDTFYVAGLLHDVGVGLMVHCSPKDYATVLQLVRRNGGRLEEFEEEVFGLSHGEVGYTLAERWRLPEILVQCIRHHGNPHKVAGHEDERVVQAVELLSFVEQWAMASGYSFVDRDAGDPPVPQPPKWLGKELAEIEQLLGETAAEVVQAEEQLFAAVTS